MDKRKYDPKSKPCGSPWSGSLETPDPLCDLEEDDRITLLQKMETAWPIDRANKAYKDSKGYSHLIRQAYANNVNPTLARKHWDELVSFLFDKSQSNFHTFMQMLRMYVTLHTEDNSVPDEWYKFHHFITTICIVQKDLNLFKTHTTDYVSKILRLGIRREQIDGDCNWYGKQIEITFLDTEFEGFTTRIQTPEDGCLYNPLCYPDDAIPAYLVDAVVVDEKRCPSWGTETVLRPDNAFLQRLRAGRVAKNTPIIRTESPTSDSSYGTNDKHNPTTVPGGHYSANDKHDSRYSTTVPYSVNYSANGKDDSRYSTTVPEGHTAVSNEVKLGLRKRHSTGAASSSSRASEVNRRMSKVGRSSVAARNRPSVFIKDKPKRTNM